MSRQLRNMTVGLPFQRAVLEALADLEEVVKLACILGMSSEILIWPLLAPQYMDGSDGVYFRTRTVHKRKVFACGGRSVNFTSSLLPVLYITLGWLISSCSPSGFCELRFDGLVEKLVVPGERRTSRSCLVSVTLAISAISLDVGRSVQMNSTPLGARWTPRRCDVYVLSFTPNLLKERLEAIKELWAAGISADLVREILWPSLCLPKLMSSRAGTKMYEGDWQSASPETMMQTCRREGIIYAVIVKAPNPHKEQMVKIKNILHRSEIES